MTNATATLTIPTVHLNGSGGTSLVDGYRDAVDQLQLALDTLAHTAPHGRDYYVNGPDVYTMARSEHEARLTALLTVQEELRTLAHGVYDQVRDRKARRA